MLEQYGNNKLIRPRADYTGPRDQHWIPVESVRLNVVVVGPHPDDQELAIGGTIALLVGQGHRVTLIDATNGEPTPFGTPEIRAKGSECCRESLGVKRIALGLVNREVALLPEARHHWRLYRELRPNLTILFLIPMMRIRITWPSRAVAEDARHDAKLTKCKIPGTPAQDGGGGGTHTHRHVCVWGGGGGGWW